MHETINAKAAFAQGCSADSPRNDALCLFDSQAAVLRDGDEIRSHGAMGGLKVDVQAHLSYGSGEVSETPCCG
ncbi:hypothetical protein [Burkholderia seminalis]|uniref:Uncharacterized protein n=1 Tax=Burkholderia seminalis TaxID=488731 RepID=A0A8A8DET4_9BURK|nr:hypothetical protein [Burkholderia seminalis]QTO23304.1 hypothetical protein DT99_035125 [Burkholderia seminalis]